MFITLHTLRSLKSSRLAIEAESMAILSAEKYTIIIEGPFKAKNYALYTVLMLVELV